MCFWTQGVLTSIIKFLFDIKSVALDTLDADAAGSSRWLLWKITVGEIAKSPVFGYLVSSMFGNTMYFTAPYFFIFLGMGYHRNDD